MLQNARVKKTKKRASERESVTESLTALSTLTVLFVIFHFKVQHRKCAVVFFYLDILDNFEWSMIWAVSLVLLVAFFTV